MMYSIARSARRLPRVRESVVNSSVKSRNGPTETAMILPWVAVAIIRLKITQARMSLTA